MSDEHASAPTPKNVVSLVSAKNKPKDEVAVTIALFGGEEREWSEIGGAYSRRLQRFIALPPLEMPYQRFEAAANQLFFRLGAKQDDVSIRPYGSTIAEVWIKPEFRERALPSRVEAYVAACKQRDADATGKGR
jgi:hypothetical protein